MLVSWQAWPLQGPVALGQAIAAASRDPSLPRRQPAPSHASPAAAPHRDRRHNTEGGLDRVEPGADERGAADGRAPVLPEPLPAKPTPPQPSKWWTLLLIIPAIATGLAIVASQFQLARKERRQGTLFKNFRRRWTNGRAHLAGHLDLMGDNIKQWSSRPVQIETTAPSSERPSPRPWYWQLSSARRKRFKKNLKRLCPCAPSNSGRTSAPR